MVGSIVARPGDREVGPGCGMVTGVGRRSSACDGRRTVAYPQLGTDASTFRPVAGATAQGCADPRHVELAVLRLSGHSTSGRRRRPVARSPLS